MRDLIRQGLNQTNLRQLIDLCNQQFATKPGIFGTLLNIFQLLEQEYDYLGAIDTARYNLINSTLETPLLDFIDAASQSAVAIIQSLDNLMEAFHKLS